MSLQKLMTKDEIDELGTTKILSVSIEKTVNPFEHYQSTYVGGLYDLG